jgi:hypothetical protein
VGALAIAAALIVTLFLVFILVKLLLDLHAEESQSSPRNDAWEHRQLRSTSTDGS